MRRAVITIILLFLLWMITFGVVWQAYDIEPFIRGGAFQYGYARNAVFHLAVITTLITGAVWVWVGRHSTAKAMVKLFFETTLFTFIVLALYMAVVLLRRALWNPSQGLTDSAMFLPVVGHTNAMFFSESRWLSFALEVLPAISVISGALMCLNIIIVRRYRNLFIARS
jgi:hypothetical protein